MKRIILIVLACLIACNASAWDGAWGRGDGGGGKAFNGGSLTGVTTFTSSQGTFFVEGGDTTWIVASDSLLMFRVEHGNVVKLSLDSLGTLRVSLDIFAGHRLVVGGATDTIRAADATYAATLGGKMHIIADNLVTVQSDSVGLTLSNRTWSTAGVPNQITPPIRLRGHVWNTTATAKDNTFDWRMDATGVSGTSPTSTLRLGHSLNGASYVNPLQVSSRGYLGINIAPNYPLHVYRPNDGAYNLVRLESASGYSVFMGLDATGFYLYENSVARNVRMGSTLGNLNQFVLNAAGTLTNGTVGVIESSQTFTSAAGNANLRGLLISPTYNFAGAQTGNVTDILVNATEANLNGASHNLFDLQVGSVSQFKVRNTGATYQNGKQVVGFEQLGPVYAGDAATIDTAKAIHYITSEGDGDTNTLTLPNMSTASYSIHTFIYSGAVASDSSAIMPTTAVGFTSVYLGGAAGTGGSVQMVWMGTAWYLTSTPFKAVIH